MRWPYLTVALVLGGIGQAKADLVLTFSGTIYQYGPNSNAINNVIFNAANVPDVTTVISSDAAQASVSVTTAFSLIAGSGAPPPFPQGNAFTPNGLFDTTLTGTHGFTGDGNLLNDLVKLTSTNITFIS